MLLLLLLVPGMLPSPRLVASGQLRRRLAILLSRLMSRVGRIV